MLITTTPDLPDADYEIIGLVRGTSIRSRSVFQDFVEWLRNLVGTELTHYTKMMAETREQALDRMIAQARQQGADAVVGVRFATTGIARGAAELLVYGTAVRIKAKSERA